MEINPALRPKHLDLLANIEGHGGAIYDVIFNNKFLYTASADKFVAKWDLAEQKQSDFAVKLEYSSYGVAKSPENNLLAVAGSNGAIHVIDVQERKEVRMLAQHKSSVFSLVFDSNKNYFYSGDRDGYFCVWDGTNFDLLLTLPFECGKIREISVNEDGSIIAINSQDGYLRLLETEYFNQLKEFHAHKDGVNCALFDGKTIYTGGKDAYLRKWNWETGQLIKEIPGHNYAVYDMEFLANQSIIVSVSFDKTIKLWDKESMEIIERVEHKNGGHRHVVNRIAKINEQEFATVSDDRKIKLWKLKA